LRSGEEAKLQVHVKSSDTRGIPTAAPAPHPLRRPFGDIRLKAVRVTQP